MIDNTPRPNTCCLLSTQYFPLHFSDVGISVILTLLLYQCLAE